MRRNLSPQKMFLEMAKNNHPRYAFDGRKHFTEWKAEARPEVLSTLGKFPEQVNPEAELIAEWVEDSVRKQKYLINTAEYISAELIVAYPETMEAGTKRPAILCCHGHGPYGKEPVMGNRSTPELEQTVRQFNYDYGHRMAKAGFITFAIDWIGFGSRNDSAKPHFFSHNGGRDWCNLYYLHATMLGMTSLSINVAHGKAAISFVSELPGVDKNRIGVMGLSGGGTMAVWMTLCDERIKASEIICYSALWEEFGINDLNYCGMQVAPGLFTLVDLPELQGLIAPAPLLVDIGIYDTCFQVDGALACFNRVKQIYEAAGAAGHLELDLFPGEHSWGGNKSVAFFKKHLF